MPRFPRIRHRTSGNCQKCGTWRQSLHRDHKIPQFEGGSDDESNCQYICANCHEDKTREDLKRFRHTEEAKKKCGVANTGVPRHTTPHTEESKKLISERTSMGQIDRPCPWVSKALAGRTRPSEVVEKMVANHVGMTGQTHSEETKIKMRLAHLGKSYASKGRPWSEARRAAQARRKVNE